MSPRRFTAGARAAAYAGAAILLTTFYCGLPLALAIRPVLRNSALCLLVASISLLLATVWIVRILRRTTPTARPVATYRRPTSGDNSPAPLLAWRPVAVPQMGFQRAEEVADTDAWTIPLPRIRWSSQPH